ncbi:MAG: DUF3718 domain-containing protein [Paraglaciecola sp.]|nr:DUF3718 domain-containing protein [Paraglaciecola sp.]
MKKLLMSVVVCAAALSFNANASLKNAGNFKFVGDTKYAALCEAAATNDLDLFKRNVKQHAFSLGHSKRGMLILIASEDNFTCSGQSIANFAQSHGAADVASYITGDSSDTDEQVTATSKYKFVGDTNFKNFCKSAVTNNVALFERAVSCQVGRLGSSKKEVMDKVLEGENVTCSGQGLVEFFQERGATNVINYISGK